MRVNWAENERAEAALREHDGKVQALARKYLREGVQLADLIQEGQLAVLRAIEKIDPSLGSGNSYVWQTIEYALLDFVKANHSTIRIPNYQFGRVWRNCTSLDSPIFDDGETTLAERIAAEEPEPSFDAEEWRLVQGAVARLKPKEIEVLNALFYEGLTFREVGQRMGCSLQNVQQIRSLALARLKKNRALRELYEGRKA